MKIIIINGANLNLTGSRERAIYGSMPFESYFRNLQEQFPHIRLEYFQSNIEGELIDKLHETGFAYSGIILNAGGYTHTSVSISDAVAAIQTPVMEVHISNVYAREDYRHKSLISKHCMGVIAGLGLDGYTLALVHLISKMQMQ